METIPSTILQSSKKKTQDEPGSYTSHFYITCIFAGVVRSNLIVYGDASKTADLLRNSEWLLRIGSVVDLVSAVLFLLAALGPLRPSESGSQKPRHAVPSAECCRRCRTVPQFTVPVCPYADKWQCGFPKRFPGPIS